MFVSSYNTYIQTDSSSRTQKQRDEGQQNNSESSFSSKLLQNIKKDSAVRQLSLPIDYTKDNNYFANRHKIQLQEKNQQNQILLKADEYTKKFSNYNTSQNATTAYESNSKLFSLLKKPKIALNQTPHTDKRLPKDIQSLQESNLRNIMVNTYINNENYYKITA